LLSALTLLALCGGCTGINHTHGVAPIDFLIPGGHLRRLMQHEPQPPAQPLLSPSEWRVEAGDTNPFPAE
jgi:hypothetical protein